MAASAAPPLQLRAASKATLTAAVVYELHVREVLAACWPVAALSVADGVLSIERASPAGEQVCSLANPGARASESRLGTACASL